MGTEKRERQKANRALRRQESQRTARRQATKRRAIRIGGLAVVALAAVVFIAWIGGAFDSDEVAAPTTPPTTAVDPADPTAPPATDPEPVEPTECPPEEGVSEPRREFAAPPEMCIDPETTYTAEVVTNFGNMTFELDPSQAPMTVNNFVVLARYRYFDDTVCHRIMPGFVIQCGDPTATGSGGPGYRFPDELPEAGEYQLGSLAMANSGPDTNGSQFFIISGPQGEALPPAYSLFGQVTEGLNTTVAAIDAVGNPDPTANGVPPLEEVRIARVTITES